MGGRAAYTLATALFVGGAGVIGYFSLLFRIIPEAAKQYLPEEDADFFD